MSKYRPNIPDEVRAKVFWAGLIVGVLATLVTGLAPLWPALAPTIAIIVSAVLGAMALLTNSLAVQNVYRDQEGEGDEPEPQRAYEVSIYNGPDVDPEELEAVIANTLPLGFHKQ